MNQKPRKLFSAEMKMLQEQGKQGNIPGQNLNEGNLSSVTNEDLMRAIQALSPVDAPNNASATAEDQEADEIIQKELDIAATLKTELRALSRSIQDTKSEIRALRSDTKGGEKLNTASSELDAVVSATEDATNSILNAVEIIDDVAQGIRAKSKNDDERNALELILNNTIKVFEACNFQDITGQRITKVVQALIYVEERINAMVEIWGEEDIDNTVSAVIEDDDQDKDLLQGPALDDAGVDQNAIDQMFN